MLAEGAMKSWHLSNVLQIDLSELPRTALFARLLVVPLVMSYLFQHDKGCHQLFHTDSGSAQVPRLPFHSLEGFDPQGRQNRVPELSLLAEVASTNGPRP